MGPAGCTVGAGALQGSGPQAPDPDSDRAYIARTEAWSPCLFRSCHGLSPWGSTTTAAAPGAAGPGPTPCASAGPPSGSQPCNSSSIPNPGGASCGFDTARHAAFVRSAESVSGVDRLKFFRYVPQSYAAVLAPPSPQPVGQQPAAQEGCDADDEAETDAAAGSGVETVGVQTAAREQEAQTDPYTPAYEVRGGGTPEELLISHLCWGRGLPAGPTEIRAIKEMQQQRQLEQLLPPPSDSFCLAMRSSLMQQQEFEKWAQRDRDIREIQEKRMKVVSLALTLRAAQLRSRNASILSRRQQQLQQQQLQRQVLTERRRQKELRRLWRARKALTSPVSLVQCQANALRSSKILQRVVPPAREGFVPPDPFTQLSQHHLEYTKDLESLDALERRLCDSAGSTAASETPGLRSVRTNATARKEAMHRKALEQTAAALQREVASELLRGSTLQVQLELAAAPLSAQSITEGASVAARRANKRALRTRPDTPRVEEVSPEEEQQQRAVLLLQQLLRGLARQQLMAEGRRSSLDRVNMLRTAEQLQDVPPQQQQAAVDRATALEAAEALLASAQGQAIAEVLEQLAKEQARLEEVQRISALAQLAARDRRLREAQERGTRQAEALLRQREDRAFKTAMQIHNQTVDSYLQSILEKAARGSAHGEALEEARLHAEQLACVVDELEALTESPQAVVGCLLNGLLLPRLQSQRQRRDEQIDAHKFRVASRLAVEEAVAYALENRSSSSSGCSGSSSSGNNSSSSSGSSSSSSSSCAAETADAADADAEKREQSDAEA